MGKTAKRASARDSKPAAPAVVASNVHPLTRVGDNLVNLVTGMGTGKDKSTSTTFAFTQLGKEQAEAAYRGDWMSRKVIDIPAYDATREWRTWQGDNDDITQLVELEKKFGLQRKAMSVLQKSRLYGGAALVLGVDQGQPEEPLDIEKLGKDCLKFVHCVNRYELTAGQLQWDIMDPWFGQPQYYERQVQGSTPTRLHPSRVCRFLGAEIPDINQSQGWGDSVLQIVSDAVIATGTVFQSMTSLVQEAKVDIVKIPELSERISSSAYEQRLKTRFAMAGVMKSIYSVLLIDKEEEWERVNQVFTGMPEVMQEFLLMVCGAADIPATRFLGQSPQGLNATGDSDTRNYYDRVSTAQTIEIEPQLDTLDKVTMISVFGKIPDGMFYNWNPLWQMTEVEKADIAVKQADVMTKDVAAALLDPMVLQKARENQLIESSFYPGIEAIIDEHGTDIDTREPEVDPNAPAMIDPQTGKPPDPNDPEAAARSQPDPNSPPPSNVVPFGKKNAPPTTPKKKAVGEDEAIESMATRIRDAELIDATTPRTLYVYRPVMNWREIAKFYKDQGVDNVYGGTAPDYMHVTLCYSKTPVDWLKVGDDSWTGSDENGVLTVKPGGARVNEQFGKYVVLAFANTDLCWRHRSILERTGASWDYEDYTPHISISRDPGAIDPLTLKPWLGQIILGPEVFEEIKVEGAVYDYKPTFDASPPAPAPVIVNVHMPKASGVVKTIEHDAQGRITKVTETPAED